MSNSIDDGLANIYALTAKIAELKEQAKNATASGEAAKTVDTRATILDFQKTLNDMLSGLLTDSTEDKKKNDSDPFAFYEESIKTQTNLTNNSTSNTSSTGTNINAAAQSAQNNLNLDNIF